MVVVKVVLTNLIWASEQYSFYYCPQPYRSTAYKVVENSQAQIIEYPHDTVVMVAQFRPGYLKKPAPNHYGWLQQEYQSP